MMGEKKFMMEKEERELIMYEKQGGRMIEIGENIGDEEEGKEIEWYLNQIEESMEMRNVLYGVGKKRMKILIDMGMIEIKMGEVERVEMKDFQMEGKRRKKLSYEERKVEKDGMKLEIINDEEVKKMIKRMREI